MNREEWMRVAIGYADQAWQEGDRPFGCVVVQDETGYCIGVGQGTGTTDDPIRHSELAAIRMATGNLGRNLYGCSLYSTHEPCVMCIGACNHAKLERVLFGSRRSDAPHLFRRRRASFELLLADTSHPPTVCPDVLRRECVGLFVRESGMSVMWCQHPDRVPIHQGCPHCGARDHELGREQPVWLKEGEPV